MDESLRGDAAWKLVELALRELLRAPVTVALCVAAIAFHLRRRKIGVPRTAADWESWGVRDLRSVRRGAWSTLWTAPLKHFTLGDLVLCLVALAYLGGALEPRIGTPVFAALCSGALAIGTVAHLVILEAGAAGLQRAVLALAASGVTLGLSASEGGSSRFRLGAIFAVLIWASIGSQVWRRHRWKSLAVPAAAIAFGVFSALAWVRNETAGWIGLAFLAAALAAAWRWRPWSPAWRFDRVWAGIRSGDFAAALPRLAALRRSFPEDGALAVLHARCTFAAGRAEEYRACVDGLRVTAPEIAESIERQSEERARFAAELEREPEPRRRTLLEARLASIDLRPDRALDLCREVLRDAPGDPEASARMARALVASRDRGEDELELAIELAERAAELTAGREPFALVALALAAARSGDVALAKSALARLSALELPPESLSVEDRLDLAWARRVVEPDPAQGPAESPGTDEAAAPGPAPSQGA
jgi:membrane associated rhomboid family serine protease